VITEQYSCDAGIEWALWKLKGSPLLTTNTNYHSYSLEPIPSEINGPSFPTTEIRFVEGSEDIEIETFDLEIEAGWHDIPLDMEGPGTVSLLIEIDATYLKVKLGETDYHLKEDPPYTPPYTAEFEIDSPGSYIIEMQIPPEASRGLVTITFTTNYPAAIYDIRAQQDNFIITVRAKAGYLGIEVISWQVE